MDCLRGGFDQITRQLSQRTCEKTLTLEPEEKSEILVGAILQKSYISPAQPIRDVHLTLRMPSPKQTATPNLCQILQQPARTVHLKRSARLRRWHEPISSVLRPGELGPAVDRNILKLPNNSQDLVVSKGSVGELWAPNYKFGLKDPSKNTKGGYVAQQVEIMCGITKWGMSH